MMATSAPVDLALTAGYSGQESNNLGYRQAHHRTQRAVRAVDLISRGMVRTTEGPRGLLEEVVRAASEHLRASWTLLVITDGQLPGARPRFLALPANSDQPLDTEVSLPVFVRLEVAAARAGVLARTRDDERWIRVPMTMEGRPVGALVGLHGLSTDPAPGDLAVLRILANQAAVSLHSSEQHQAELAVQRRVQRLYDEVRAGTRDLELRDRELRRAESRLVLAHQRELIDTERHRIARELHDSVAQYVLSAGMAIEVARGEAVATSGSGSVLNEQLTRAKDLAQQAVNQLRRAIYALDHKHSCTRASLPELIREIAVHHRPQLDVQVRIDGPVEELTTDADHDIARAVGEAMFNVAMHARATRATVRLRYRADELLVSIADNGTGDPKSLSRLLRLERDTWADGCHRGLANIENRITELGGRVTFRRARIGGVRVELRVPLPLPIRAPIIHRLAPCDAAPPQGAAHDND